MFTLTLLHILVIIAFFCCFVLFVFVTRGRRPISNILAWLFFMFLMPYIGIPLFLIFGQRKLDWVIDKKRLLHAKQSSVTPTTTVDDLLNTFGILPPTTDNTIELITDGVNAYQTLATKIQNSQHSILITTYRVTDDPVGNAIVELLTQKAAQGVQVCLLLDRIGNFMMYPKRKLKPLIKAGGSIRYIMPLFHTPFRGRVNLRDHRKIIIFDGKTALIGGMNIAQEYMGPTPEKKRWTDLSAIIQGSAVTDLLSVFESDWQFAASNMESKSYHRPLTEHSCSGNSVVQTVASGPDTIGDRLYDAVLSAIFAAKKSIYVVTPYFVLDDTLQKAFLIAVRRGVNVNIIIPRHSNHPVTDLVRSIGVRKLHDEGAKIWFYPKMILAKAMIFDDTLGIIGSANLDLRSLLLNFEISCFLYSKKDLTNLQNFINSLLPQCSTEFKKASLPRMWLEDAVQLIKPLLWQFD